MERKITSLSDAAEYIDNVFTPKNYTTGEKKCDLCNITRRTKWYYENDKWVICDCKTCGRAMIVYRKHTMYIPLLDWVIILGKVIEIFGSEIVLRFKQKQIKNHFHIHIYNRREGK